jgi:hypothetical protein
MERKINTIVVRCLFYSCLILFSGCGSLGTQPDLSFKSSSEVSLVFGRLEIIKDGVQLNPSNFYLHVDAVISSKQLDPDDPAYQKCKKCYLVHIINSDGYFFVALPPAKYKYVDIRAPQNWVDYSERQKPAFVFDVVPAKATYIGTLRITATTGYIKEKEKVGSSTWGGAIDSGYELAKEGMSLLSSLERKVTSTRLTIKSEFDEARKVFYALYSNHPEPVESLLVSYRR